VKRYKIVQTFEKPCWLEVEGAGGPVVECVQKDCDYKWKTCRYGKLYPDYDESKWEEE